MPVRECCINDTLSFGHAVQPGLFDTLEHTQSISREFEKTGSATPIHIREISRYLYKPSQALEIPGFGSAPLAIRKK